MKSLNAVTLLGNVTHNPELKKPTKGQTVCTFGLATNYIWKDAKGTKQSQVEFHNLVAWGKLGELCGKYVKKGKPVYIKGRLKTGSWENAQGVKLHRTEIILDDLILLDAKKGASDIEHVAVSEEAGVA